MKPDPKLAAFYADLISEKLVEERKRARAEKVDPNDPIFQRQPFEGPCHTPYTKKRKRDGSRGWVVGYTIPGTVYTLLRGPFKKLVGKYPKRFVEVRCLCNRVREVRCDNIHRDHSSACRSCAAKLRWARYRKGIG